MLIFASSGPRYKIGRTYGELFRQELKTTLHAFWDEAKAKGQTREEIITLAKRTEDNQDFRTLEEIRGIADGSKLPYTQLLAFNLFKDIFMPEECTVMIAIRKATASGKTLAFKNSDVRGFNRYVGSKYHEHKPIHVLTIVEPEDGLKVIGITELGSLDAKIGLNEKGVEVVTNIARTRALNEPDYQTGELIAATPPRGLSWQPEKYCTRGDAMKLGWNSSTAKEGAQKIANLLIDRPQESPGNISCIDWKEGYTVEGSFEGAAVEFLHDGDVAARSNMHKLLKELNKDGDTSSICRYTRVMELLNVNKGKISPQNMIEIAMDHANGPGPNSICRHIAPVRSLSKFDITVNENETWREETTVASGGAEIDEDPMSSRVFLAPGKPCHTYGSGTGALEIRMDLDTNKIPKDLMTMENFRKHYNEKANTAASIRLFKI